MCRLSLLKFGSVLHRVIGSLSYGDHSKHHWWFLCLCCFRQHVLHGRMRAMHETIGVETLPVKGPNVYDVKLSRRYLQKSIASLQRHCPYLHHCHPGKVGYPPMLHQVSSNLIHFWNQLFSREMLRHQRQMTCRSRDDVQTAGLVGLSELQAHKDEETCEIRRFLMNIPWFNGRC